MIIVTTNDVPGYAIEAVLGEVMGTSVRRTDSGAELHSIGGAEVTAFTKLVHDSRNEVLQRMRTDAARRGANAVVGMRFDTGDIATTCTQVCAYGTAVVVRPLRADEPGATPQSMQQAAARSAPATAPQPTPGQPAPGPHGYSPQVPPPTAGPDQPGGQGPWQHR